MNRHWPKVRLGEVLQHRKEFITIDDIEIYRRPRVQLHAQGIVLRDEVPGSLIKTKKQQVCRSGELLVAEIDAKVGGFGIVPEGLDGAVVSSHYFLFELDATRLERQFLDYFIRTHAFREQVEAQGSTNYAAIRPAHVLGYEIPLPPLAEQRRIVARIEELAAQIHEARALRQQGDKETDALVRSARNRVFRDLKRRLALVRLDAVADSRLGKMLDPRAKTGVGSTPYLRNANVQWDHFDLRDVFEMDFSDEERKEFALQRGDILVCEGGDIGKSAIWNDEIPGCCYQKALHRVRCHPEKTIPRFLLNHLFWAASEGHWLELKTQTTIPHLTGVKLKAYPVFIPSIEEQHHIVAELDALQAEVDALKRHQADTAAELGALLPAILDRTFRGEL